MTKKELKVRIMDPRTSAQSLCDKGEIFEGLSKDSRAFLDPLEVNFINYDTCNKFIRIVNVDSWAFTRLCFQWRCSYGNVFLP